MKVALNVKGSYTMYVLGPQKVATIERWLPYAGGH